MNQTSNYRWIIMAISWMVYLIYNMERLSIGPLAPFFKESLQITNTQVGLLATANTVLFALVLLAAGWLVDRFGVRPVLLAGSVFGGITVCLVYFSSNYQGLVIILAFAGLGYGCVFPAISKALLTWFPAKERATVMGFNQAAVNAGGIVAALLLPAVALAWSWQSSYLVVGIALIVICLVFVVLYHEPPGAVMISVGSPGKTGNRSALRALLKSRDLWIIALAGYFLSVVEFSSINNIVLYLNEGLEYSLLAAGGLLAITQAAGGVGKPLAGVISDRWFGHKRKPMFLIMATVSGIACLVLGSNLSAGNWLVYIMMVLIGATALGFGGIFITMLGEMAGPGAAGFASGFLGTIMALGGLSGPPLYGFIVDATGSFAIAWLAMGGFAVACAVLLLLVREQKSNL
ncbi:MAG: MFS transporter [Dehalococcoidales bacterium]|nr:MFS transporter [Dehalococcoidales bacterium]